MHVESTSTDFQIERLIDDTALIGPELLQGRDQTLKGFNIVAALTHNGSPWLGACARMENKGPDYSSGGAG
jgi:hypothetical protein